MSIDRIVVLKMSLSSPRLNQIELGGIPTYVPINALEEFVALDFINAVDTWSRRHDGIVRETEHVHMQTWIRRNIIMI